MAEEDAAKPDDAEVLYPDREVAGFKVRPWSLGRMLELLPTIREVRKVLEDADIPWNLEDIGKRVPDATLIMMPFAPKILSVTLDITEEEVLKLSIEQTSTLLLVIAVQNMRHLGNSFGLGLAAIRAMTAKVAEEET